MKDILKLAKLEAKKIRTYSNITDYEAGFIDGYLSKKKKNRWWKSWFNFTLYNK